MLKLIKDPKVRGLYRDATTGIYYARRYFKEVGEIKKSLETTEREAAMRALDRVVVRALKDEAPKEKVIFDDVAYNCALLKKSMATATYIGFYNSVTKHLLPFYTGMPIQKVGMFWREYKVKQRELTPGRKLGDDKKALRYILGYAEEKNFITGIPKLKLDPQDKIRAKGKEYSNEEYSKLGQHLSARWALKKEIALTTGMRRGVIESLKWDYIDWQNRVIRLPAHLDKMREDRIYPIEDQVFELLSSLHEAMTACRFVFPHRDDPMRCETKSNWTRERLGMTANRLRARPPGKPGVSYALEPYRLWGSSLEQSRGKIAALSEPVQIRCECILELGLTGDVARGLRWDWFDWEKGRIEIPRQRRKIELSSDMLSRFRARLELARKPIFVFPNLKDPKRHESKGDSGWQRAKKRANVTGKFHSFRNTAVTRALRGGSAANIVQRGVGMSSVVMRDVYVRSHLGDLQKMARSIRKSLPKNNGPKSRKSVKITRKNSETGRFSR